MKSKFDWLQNWYILTYSKTICCNIFIVLLQINDYYILKATFDWVLLQVEES